MRTQLGVFVRLALLLSITTSCASQHDQGAAEKHEFLGHLVLGVKASEFGLTPGDSLREHRASGVPAGLRLQADSIAASYGLQTKCSRFFGSGPFAVLIAKSCTEPPKNTHRWDVVLFRQVEGRFVPDSQSFAQAVDTWCPPVRDEQGSSKGKCN